MVQQPATEFQLLLKAFGYLRTHWWLFLLEISVIYGFALHRYYRAAPVYDSSAQILIDNSRRQLYQSYVLAGMTSTNARKQNMAHLLAGHEVLARLRSHLTELFNAEGRPPYLRPFFPGGTALASTQLRSFVSIAWDKNSDIYNLSCNSENPDAARAICLAYMNTVQTYYPEIGQREAMMKREFLSRQIASLTRQIAEKERNLVDFQRKNSQFMTFMLQDGEGQGRSRLQAEMLAVQEKLETNRATKKLMLTLPNAKRGEHVTQETSISALTTRLTDLQYQYRLTEQSRDFDREQRLTQLQAEIDQLSARLGRLNDEEVQVYIKNPLAPGDVRKRVAELELDYRVTSIRKASLQTRMEELNGREKQFSQQRLEYDRINTELKHKRKLLTNLYNKEQETELELSAGNAEIYRLQEPARNVNRISPQLSRYLYGSLSMTLFTIAISIVLLMAFFPRLDSEAEVNRLNLPVIGKIPFMRRATSALIDLPTMGLEYLKILNYRIMRETKDTQCPVVIITSPYAREGKSTVSYCLTMSSQSPSRRILLIDGDLLTSRPNNFFGIQEDQTPGLRSILDAQGDVDHSSLIVHTLHEGISLMPRGERVDPAQLPSFSVSMERMIKKLRTEYDMIFIDTPPLFAANLAHQWAGMADLIVLVARLLVTRAKDVTEGIQTCKIFSRASVGIVLNCVPISGPFRRSSTYYFSKRKSGSDRLAA